MLLYLLIDYSILKELKHQYKYKKIKQTEIQNARPANTANFVQLRKNVDSCHKIIHISNEWTASHQSNF